MHEILEPEQGALVGELLVGLEDATALLDDLEASLGIFDAKLRHMREVGAVKGGGGGEGGGPGPGRGSSGGACRGRVRGRAVQLGPASGVVAYMSLSPPLPGPLPRTSPPSRRATTRWR